MNENISFGKTRLLCSQKAEEGAERLIDRIERGQLLMDIMPNQYARFSGELEEQNYVSYCRFLHSFNGKKILSMLEEEDARNSIEL